MVHNLSGVEFTQGEMELLNKDLNFVEPPKIPPLEEIIVGVHLDECLLKNEMHSPTIGMKFLRSRSKDASL
jgi:hypothetical protein